MDRIFIICVTFKFSIFVIRSLLTAGGPYTLDKYLYLICDENKDFIIIYYYYCFSFNHVILKLIADSFQTL